MGIETRYENVIGKIGEFALVHDLFIFGNERISPPRVLHLRR